MSATTLEASPFVQGPRIIRDELPIVYAYDHCPFCVRVRLALGIKNVKHNVHFLQNDDINTPTKLIGKKIAPIFVSEFLLTLLYDFVVAKVEALCSIFVCLSYFEWLMSHKLF